MDLAGAISYCSLVSTILRVASNEGDRTMRPEDFIAERNRPFTGAEYMESLRDGREVYFNGERVSDVTDAPGLPQFGPLDRAAV